MSALVQYASRLDLPRTESQVHTILASYLYSDRGGQPKESCFPSHRAIAKAAKLSMSAVRKALYRLQKKGFWIIEARFAPDQASGKMRQRSNLYTAGPWLSLWRSMRKGKKKLSTAKSARGDVPPVPPNNLKEEKNKQKREISPAPPAYAPGAPPSLGSGSLEKAAAGIAALRNILQ